MTRDLVCFIRALAVLVTATFVVIGLVVEPTAAQGVPAPPSTHEANSSDDESPPLVEAETPETPGRSERSPAPPSDRDADAPRSTTPPTRDEPAASASGPELMTSQSYVPGSAPAFDGDFPDPDVLKVGSFDDTWYYAYATNAANLVGFHNVPVWRSRTLRSWEFVGNALPNPGRWVDPNHHFSIWAPGVHQFGGTYVLYYTAPLNGANRQCIGRATSSSPGGPFVDNDAAPLVCQTALGGSIDADTFVDPSGATYLLWRSDGIRIGCPGCTGLYSQRVVGSGGAAGRLIGGASELLRLNPALEGDHIENPAMVWEGGIYRLFYSAGFWQTGTYRTGYARCSSPNGGCVRQDSDWLGETAYGQGTGGASFIRDDLGRFWIAYHGWKPKHLTSYPSGGQRVFFADHVRMDTPAPTIDTATNSPANPGGRIDAVSGGPEQVRVSGWTVDPNTTNPIDVHVWVNGTVGAAGHADLDRPDIAAAFAGYGRSHGYDVVVHGVLPGTWQVCAYGINVSHGTGNPPISCTSVTVPSGAPVGYYDAVQAGGGKIKLSGWAIDPDTTGSATIHVYANNNRVWIGAHTANASRPDVGAAYPGYGNDHGFDQIIGGTYPGGSIQNICVWAINVAGTGVNIFLGCRNVPIPTGNPIGHLDSAGGQTGRVRLAGWAIDPDALDAIDIHVYIDDVYRQTLVANAARPDVAAVFPIHGPSHGFDVAVAAAPGTRNACVWAINTSAGASVLLGCRQVAVA